MRFEKFISKKSIDEELLYKKAISLDETVLGDNTWLYLKHPILESYYDVTDGLNEDEINHFAKFNVMLLEKKMKVSQDDDEIKELEKEIKAIEKANKADDTWFADDDGVGFRNKKWEKELGKNKDRKKQSWRGQKRKDTDPKYNKEPTSNFKEFVSGVSKEDQKTKELSKELTDWDKEVEKVYNDITIWSRKQYHKLNDLGKKSFIVKYILHGLEASATGKAAEPWGRAAKTAKDDPKKIASDHIKSFEQQKQFTKDVLEMFKKEQESKSEGAAKKVRLLKRYKGPTGIEMALAKSTDKVTQDLLDVAKDLLQRGAFKDDGGAGYMEMLFKISAKEYKDVKELKKCAEQWKAFSPNRKTFKNIDITTVCPKRKQLKEMQMEYAQAAQDYLDSIKRGAGQSRVLALKANMERMKVTSANNPTCPYCYVELGREGGATFLAKAEKEGQTYQDEFQDWIKKDKKGNPEKDGGNYVIKGGNVKTRDALNKMGGLRFFGSSDYTENAYTDSTIERIIADAAKVGLQLKAITKQKKFVEKYGGRTFEEGPLEGKPVFNINMSVDEQKGFKLDDAIRMKKRYPKNNVNIRVVARNPEEAVKYSLRPEVDVITLLHFKERGERLKNKELYVNMSPGTTGWKTAIKAMKEAHPRANWTKVLSKLCCSTKGNCKKCPNACGFNPSRVSDFTQLAKGGQVKFKTSDMELK